MLNSLLKLESLVTEGWDYHDTESERLARELEAADIEDLDEGLLSRSLGLANHTIGEHLGDWPRALAFVAKTCYANPSHRTNAAASMQLAISYYMNRQIAQAMEAEVNAISNADDSLNAYVELRAQLAGVLVGSGRVDDATRLIQGLNRFANQDSHSTAVARSLAISNNNIASELLDVKHKNRENNALMLECARAALALWRKCGTWVNEERARYLLALVYNHLGEYKQALKQANHALRVIFANGNEDVDEAFIHLAAANATCGHSQDADEAAQILSKADSLVAKWTDKTPTSEYEVQREIVVAKISQIQ